MHQYSASNHGLEPIKPTGECQKVADFQTEVRMVEMKINSVRTGGRFVVYRTKNDNRWHWALHLSHYGIMAIAKHRLGYATKEAVLSAVGSAARAFRWSNVDGALNVEFRDQYRFCRRHTTS